VIRTSIHEAGRVVVANFAEGEHLTAQPHREIMAGWRVVEAAGLESEVRGRTALMRNDCSSALRALEAGSYGTVFMDDLSQLWHTWCRDHGMDDLYLHAPGKVLVAEGIDGLSRETAENVNGPASGDRLRELVRYLVMEQGWGEVTLDLFASRANTLVPRYFSWFAEAEAELTDAFASTGWDRSACPHCGEMHRETIFAFPPEPLVEAFVRRAAAEGVRGVVVVPHKLTAAYWPRLVAASLLAPRERHGCICLGKADRHVTHAPRPLVGDLAVFVVDFGGTSGLTPSAGCGREGYQRVKAPRESQADRDDRWAICKALRLCLGAPSRRTPRAPNDGGGGGGEYEKVGWLR
jgi:hypothetical protein